MIYDVTLVDLPRRPTLVTRFSAAPDQFGRQFLERFRRICDVAEAQACTLTDAPFARYLGADGPLLHVEIGIIVAADPLADGDILPSELPAGHAARTTHFGPYEILGEAHAALREWATEHGHVASGPLFEVYLSDPAEGDDPASWRTAVFLPLTG